MLEDDSRGEEIKFTTTKQNVRQPLPLQYFIKDVHEGLDRDHRGAFAI